MEWTEGRALIGTGSPFPAVNWHGRRRASRSDQQLLHLPRHGLGHLVGEARRVTDTMFMAAAKCLAELSPALGGRSERLLPPVSELRSVSFAVAKAVALQAIADGVAEAPVDETIESRICANVWQPEYLPYRFCPGLVG